ncbi:hypothetical protein XENOCAPTIV_016339 [Xenoophorus captivus]|uniref:Uncharacterized protein n=1 Tax=Xenoophorus captivus TaxID=1517983 RepID=A0ABV0SI30_9TELE
MFGMGNEVDIHSAFFHGNTLLNHGHRTDTISLFPATFSTASMIPKMKGKWLLSCQVNDHLQGRKNWPPTSVSPLPLLTGCQELLTGENVCMWGVDPGKKFTYRWQVLEGPSFSDSPCIPYLYYSGTDPVMDTNSGLVGPLLVCKRGALGKNGIQVGVL